MGFSVIDLYKPKTSQNYQTFSEETKRVETRVRKNEYIINQI